MISTIRFPFFIVLSIAFHLACFSLDYHFPVISSSRQISFGYISSAREGFVPEKKPTVQIAVKSKRSVVPLPKIVQSAKIPTKKDAVVKKALVASVPPAISPTNHSTEALVERTSPSIAPAAVVTDLDAAREPLLMDENLEAEVDDMIASAGSSYETLPRDQPVENGDGQLSVKKSGVADGFQAALPRYDLNPKPVYPEVARRRGWEGTVLFEVLVLKSGRVGALEMVQSSGYRSLDRAARKAIRGWVFKAATSFGLAVDSRVVVPVDFVLDQ